MKDSDAFLKLVTDVNRINILSLRELAKMSPVQTHLISKVPDDQLRFLTSINVCNLDPLAEKPFLLFTPMMDLRAIVEDHSNLSFAQHHLAISKDRGL